MAEKRRCGTCQIQKVLSFDNFYRCNQKYAKGYGHICKPCYRKRDGARRVEHNAASSRHLKKLRLAALQAYSGKSPHCACCRESNLEFLSIDHIHGGGRKHRMELKGKGVVFCRWLRDQGYPPGFRVLCHNCNFSMGIYGYCPHRRKIHA